MRLVEHGDSLIVELGGVYTVASTVSGVTRSEFIVFRRVPRDFDSRDVEGYRRRVLSELGLPGGTPVFLTAVDPSTRVHLAEDGVHVVATVGLEHVVCVEEAGSWEPPIASTINVLVVVEEPRLSMPALLELLAVAASARSIAVSLSLAWCKGRPLGTVTDAFAVAGRVGEGGVAWAGPATRLGWRVARLVRDAVLAGDSRGPGERLRGVIGLGLDELVEEALRLYAEAPIPGLDERRVADELRGILGWLLRDPNVWAVLVAMRAADEHGVAGAIPGLGRGEYEADTPRIVADELLAAALALYAAGFRGLLATYWVDRVKRRRAPRIASLPVFADDAASALIGSALTILYDRYAGGGGAPGGHRDGGGQGVQDGGSG